MKNIPCLLLLVGIAGLVFLFPDDAPRSRLSYSLPAAHSAHAGVSSTPIGRQLLRMSNTSELLLAESPDNGKIAPPGTMKAATVDSFAWSFEHRGNLGEHKNAQRWTVTSSSPLRPPHAD